MSNLSLVSVLGDIDRVIMRLYCITLRISSILKTGVELAPLSKPFERHLTPLLTYYVLMKVLIVNKVSSKGFNKRVFVRFIWWRHQMETLSTLLAICVGNSPITGEYPAQGPVTWSFDVFFDLRLNKRLSKEWRNRWFETPSAHYDVTVMNMAASNSCDDPLSTIHGDDNADDIKSFFKMITWILRELLLNGVFCRVQYLINR